jgi:hypothetical protein
VATDDRDGLIGWVSLLDLRDEAGGTDDIQGGDTQQTLCGRFGYDDSCNVFDLMSEYTIIIDIPHIFPLLMTHEYQNPFHPYSRMHHWQIDDRLLIYKANHMSQYTAMTSFLCKTSRSAVDTRFIIFFFIVILQ